MNKYILITVIIATLFTSCSKNNPIYTTKIYKNISNDDILNATKKVLKLSDVDFKINSNANKVNAQRTIAIYKIYDVKLRINTINLYTKTDNDIVVAKLEIKQNDDYFDKEKIIKTPAVHELLWSRIDYVLGLNKTWPTCFEYNLKLNYDGIICNRLYNENKRAYKKDIIVHTKIKEDTKKEDELEKIDLESLEKIDLPNFDIGNISNSNDTNILDINDSNNTKSITILDSNTNEALDINESNISNVLSKINIDMNKSNNIDSKPILNTDTNESNISLILTKIKTNEYNTSLILPDINNTIDINDSNITNLPKKQNIDINSTKINNNDFKTKFMNADPKKYYTINMALFKNKINADKFISKYNIKENSLIIYFKKNKNEFYKIMYGLYETKDKAKEALNKLPKQILANKPTIEGVARKQILLKTNDIKLSKKAYKNNKVILDKNITDNYELENIEVTKIQNNM